MKFFRKVISIICLVACFIATAGEEATAKCAVNPAASAELKLLQGTWEGVQVGDDAHQKITIRIAGNSLHFHRDTNFWFDTTITVPQGKDPKQLHATIKACPPAQRESIGKVVRAFFNVEERTLTVATIGDDAEETQQSFEEAGTRYELRKVQPKDNPKGK